MRWATIESLASRFASRPIASLDAPVRAAIVGGGAQLLFLDRVPDHAAIHATVEWAKRRAAKASGLVNALLRRLSEIRTEHSREAWRHERDALPLADGTALVLREALLPEPMDRRLAAACSLPVGVVRGWIERFGEDEASRLARHALVRPPTVLNVAHATVPVDDSVPHDEVGSAVWTGGPGELGGFLETRQDVWVQDASSSATLALAGGIRPRSVVDLCAGLGTKTRQIERLFPEARVIAADVDDARLRELRSRYEGSERVTVCHADEAGATVGSEGAELVLLDVPCTNSGVLPRRPEARYRLGSRQAERLAEIQDGIVARGASLLAPGGKLLYATCSIEHEENEARVESAVGRYGLRLERAAPRSPRGLPGDPPMRYADGAFAALLGGGG